MSMGRWEPKQEELFVATTELRSPAHPFYERVAKILADGRFDEKVEGLCEKFYSESWGRRSIPPGVFFRMLFVGYFEGIASERGIVWRCEDSRSLRTFLGLRPSGSVPDHSALSIIRRRLDEATFKAVFAIVLDLLAKAGLVKGDEIAIDSTMMAANAAMRSIVRKDTKESYAEFAKRLATEAGEKVETAEDVARADAKREDKTVSNADWESTTDPSSKIARMKDGTTHMAYKPEHAIDVSTGAIVAVTVNPADEGDRTSLVGTLVEVERALAATGDGAEGVTIVADKGYHSDEVLEMCHGAKFSTCIAVPNVDGRRDWKGKSAASKRSYRRNRRRVRSKCGKALMRRRGETIERSFAHLCDRGKMRRTYLRGLENVTKSYLMRVAGHNLGVVMRKLVGAGTPRGFRDLLARLFAAFGAALSLSRALRSLRVRDRLRIVTSRPTSASPRPHLPVRRPAA